MEMKYFKDSQGWVHGFDETDPAQHELMNNIAMDWEDITANWPPPPGAEETRQQLQSDVQVELAKTDNVTLRCFKAGIPFPEDWQRYTLALRAIVNGSDTSSTSLPAQPDYPAGT